jgi:RNA polymerase sigma factor (TIGR02999 family)
MSELTLLIQRAAEGDREAFNAAFAAIREELRGVAIRRLRADPRATLSPTMLVNETWLKLADGGVHAESRAHFFHIAAQAMRQVWIDKQRSRAAELERIRLYVDSAGSDAVASSDAADWAELIDWDAALKALEQSDPELAELVALRVFSGLELAELATLKGVSLRTIQRQWRSARAFLLAM